VEVVGGPAAIRQEQETETDLGHDQRLGECEQLRDRGSRVSAAPSKERRGGSTHADADHQECVDVMRR
jgi:hypothetical protein